MTINEEKTGVNMFLIQDILKYDQVCKYADLKEAIFIVLKSRCKVLRIEEIATIMMMMMMMMMLMMMLMMIIIVLIMMMTESLQNTVASQTKQ